MPPLLADFTHARPCKPFCEKYLTLPGNDVILMEGKMKDKWVIILYILGSAVGILLTRLILG